jgi:predicted Zn-dependent peptidase
MKRAELVRYFRERYRPDQLIVAVAGDVSHEAVKRKLAPLASRRWPGRPEGRGLPKPYGEPPPPLRPGFWWCERRTEQVHLLWGVRGPSYSSNDRFAAFLLNVYLGGGMSSALFQEIREKNALAYSVYSSLTPFCDSGTFNVYAATGMAQVPLCLRLIEEAVERLQTELLSEEELRVVQDNFKGTVLLSADSVESRMSSIARNEIFFGRYVPVEEICARIDEVTPEQLRKVARKGLKDDHRSILALGPKPSRALRARFGLEMLKR